MDIMIKWILTVITIVLILALTIIGIAVFGLWKLLGVDMFIIPFAIWIICLKNE